MAFLSPRLCSLCIFALLLTNAILCMQCASGHILSGKTHVFDEKKILEVGYFDDLEKETPFGDGSYYLHTLQNKRLIFIGDSVTRYQYISLVYSLENGKYLDRNLFPSPVKQKDYGSWYNFYVNVSNSLHMWCDCLKASTGNSNVQSINKEDVENWYYFNEAKNLSLIYLWSTMGEYAQGHWSDSGDYDSYRLPLPGFVKYFWRKYFPDALNWAMNDANPPWARKYEAVLVMNAGIHANILWEPDYNFNLWQKINWSNIDKFIWKTTTHDTARPKLDFDTNYHKGDYHMCGHPFTACFNTSITYQLSDSPDLVVDNVHFTPPVYNKLNYDLMQVIQNDVAWKKGFNPYKSDDDRKNAQHHIHEGHGAGALGGSSSGSGGKGRKRLRRRRLYEIDHKM